MIEIIKAKFKAFFKWIYDWITVLVGAAMGFVSLLPNLLTELAGIDLSPLVGPERALQVVTATAILKALIAFWQSRKTV